MTELLFNQRVKLFFHCAHAFSNDIGLRRLLTNMKRGPSRKKRAGAIFGSLLDERCNLWDDLT